MTTYFTAKELLAPPTERAAFSDRQAYVCAELSKLAYFKFEGGHSLDQALDLAHSVFKDDARLKAFEEQLKLVLTGAPGSEPDGVKVLKAILAGAGFDLVEAFSKEGTQGFLCTKESALGSGGSKRVAFLVFRGTEPTEFADIRADIRSRLRTIGVGNESFEIHEGFLEAFQLVQGDVEAGLKTIAYDQLILTGHSLGGALAMVATRILAPDCIGACYTFGAPPIGTIELQNTLKTPVYEIVNEVDIVPRLPNPWMAAVFVYSLRFLRILAKSVTFLNSLLAKGTWDKRLEERIEMLTRYRHPGYVSYLVGSGSEAHLRFNVDGFDRMKWWSKMMWKKGIGGFGKMVHDHSIDLYIAKLTVHARHRR